MRIEGQFEAPGRPDDVMLCLADVERMARCLPGASIESCVGDGEYLGAITLSLGPKKMVFRGQVNCEFDIDAKRGILTGKASSNVRGTHAGGRTTFEVKEAASSTLAKPISLVEIVSEAELSGPLADFARTGGTIVANALIADFAERLAADLADLPNAATSGETLETSRVNDAGKGSGQSQLSVTRIGWLIVKSQFLRFFRWASPRSRPGP